ncbi:hypothetical protein [Membranihabitans maritimus]|uniref:hypothetical protein n=1 Tax=Membranihabitans maritimus TaxID=2904244 RepID=UPI001F2E26EA|nr:hypothetical protein [Membranihabitans maritimus]
MQVIWRDLWTIRFFYWLGLGRSKLFPVLVLLTFCCLFFLFPSCGPGSTSSPPKKGTIKTTFRYLESEGQLKGYLNFYQLTQNDSLVPDPRLYHFEIDEKLARSGQMDNSYFTYFLVDTINSNEFQLNILPDKATVRLGMPRTPNIEVDSLFRDRPWVISWKATDYNIRDDKGKEKFLITVVISDVKNNTVLKKSSVDAGELVFTPEELSALQPGVGFYYIISTLKEKKEAVRANFTNVMETYSTNHEVEIYAGEVFEDN